MSWHEVDMAADPRGGQFAYFRQMVDPFAGVTAAVDITDFLAALDGRPFFLSLLYAVTRAANRVPQLRRRILDGRVVEYDWCSPSYTLMKPDGVYVYSLIEGERTYGDFIAEGQRQQALPLDRGTLTEDGDSLGNFFVSCLPWLDYLQVKHPVVSADDSNPRISWGRYTERGGRVTLPVSIFVNHALADGLHIAQFYSCLDKELRELVKLLRSQEK